MENQLSQKLNFSGIFLVLGSFVLGFFIYKGLKTFSDKDRVVTVKGLAEMNMEASSATISIDFNISGDDLQALVKQSEGKKNLILDYLKAQGYASVEVSVSSPDINDRQTYYEYVWERGEQVQKKVDRYSISQRMSIKNKNVKEAEKIASKIEWDLVSKNLTSNIYTNYIFPELNTIKPKLIAESTKNARIAGEQFANDSQAKLGKIKTASQGQITIAGKYYYEEEQSEMPKEPYLQKARVVSTIVFFLE